jgi:hypothetical protein
MTRQICLPFISLTLCIATHSTHALFPMILSTLFLSTEFRLSLYSYGVRWAFDFLLSYRGSVSRCHCFIME